MAREIITTNDLDPFAQIEIPKAKAMIADALADASRVAPCITDDELPDERVAQFKSVLRAAILRWNESGSGAIQTQINGPFSQTQQYQGRRAMFWPSEIEALQRICRDHSGQGETGAFTIDQVQPTGGSDGLDDRPDLWFQYR